ncbi:MAG: radical SAM protein [Calditrichia bacterium]|nr:radical SAM protein [Calditrichia bacterium]
MKNHNYIPSYLGLKENLFQEKIEQGKSNLENCQVCPRHCGVNRLKEELGECRAGYEPVISSYFPHFGEEAPLVGQKGSGTIFIGGCNLQCLFCQNYGTSHQLEGGPVSIPKLADMMLALQENGSHNINIVTPSHIVPQLIEALFLAAKGGLSVPLVYNCGGYENPEIITQLQGIVDIYMPDFKYTDPQAALTYSKAEDYPDVAKAAIKEMHRQVGDLVMDKKGIALRGLLVRHLVLPESMAGTEKVAKFLVEEISDNTYTNIMAQYYPCFRTGETPPLNRRITGDEYRSAVKTAVKAGLKRLD